MTDAPTHDASDFETNDALTHGEPISVIVNKGDRAKYARRLCFTLNNWTEEERRSLLADFNLYASGWIIGEECGAKKGTPHLQGYVEMRNERAYSAVNAIVPRCHWANARKVRLANVRYCSKGTNINSTFPKEEQKPVTRRDIEKTKVQNRYVGVTWWPWQDTVITLYHSRPEPRTIYWFWEPKGKQGKSFLYKYLASLGNIIIAEGKANDVFNQLNEYLNQPAPENYTHTTAIINIPRCMQQEWISYQAIERLKDGCLYSGKYEGGVCVMDEIHVIVFSNAPPEWEKFSEDRWEVYEIINKDLERTKRPEPEDPSRIKKVNYY